MSVVASRAPRLIRFGVFEMDLETGELRRRGRRVPLPHQAFVVLALIAERRGGIVTREELRQALWGDAVHVDHERGLNYCVNRIRRALGDEAHAPRFVETLPRRGYRFLATLERDDDFGRVPAGTRTTASEPQPASRPGAAQPGARPVLLLMAAFALVVQAAGTPRRSPAGGPGLPSPDPLAQAAFEKGRALLENGPTGWRRSVAYFAEAARRDPGFALAPYGMADAYMRLGEHGALDADQAFPEARAAARKALAIEERAEPLVILAALDLNYDWDWAGAEHDYLHALHLDPTLLGAQAGYARLLSAAGRHAEAIQIMRDIEAREPGCGEVVRDAALVYYRAHRFDDAARYFRRWAELHPEEKEPHHWLALLHHLEGRLVDAKGEARSVLVMGHADPQWLSSFDALSPEPALERYLRGSVSFLRRLSESERVTADDFARLYAHLGERERALDALAQAADERSPQLLPFLADPAFDELRGDPRFRALLQRVGAPVPGATLLAPALTTVALLR